MNICKKEHKKFRKIVSKLDGKEVNTKSLKNENVPLWFNDKQEKEIDNLEELNNVLKEFE